MLGSDLLGHLYSHLETTTMGLTTPSREDRSTALTRPCFMLAELCYNHLWLQNVPSPKRKPVPISSHPPQHLTTRNPLSVSVDRPVLDASHQWTHTLCVLCLLLS